MTRYTFQLGSHDLNDKKGHTKACGAVQARLSVFAIDLDDAVNKANLALFKNFAGGAMIGHKSSLESTFEFTIEAKVTRRNLIAEAE